MNRKASCSPLTEWETSVLPADASMLAVIAACCATGGASNIHRGKNECPLLVGFSCRFSKNLQPPVLLAVSRLGAAIFRTPVPPRFGSAVVGQEFAHECKASSTDPSPPLCLGGSCHLELARWGPTAPHRALPPLSPQTDTQELRSISRCLNKTKLSLGMSKVPLRAEDVRRCNRRIHA